MQLQVVDNKLQSLEEIKGDLPYQVNKLKKQLSDAEPLHGEKQQQLQECIRARLKAERELEVLKARSEKYQEQLYAVTTNREYDAITLEIDTIKEQISATETEILEQIESEEMLTEEEKSLVEEIATLQQSITLKEAELGKKIQATEAESGQYTRQRQELVKGIKGPILYQYERIRKGIGGTAVVQVSNYACTGCHATIPPQKVSEIRTMDTFILCESCGRILVYNNGEDTGSIV
jgi:predicted  nucleic acid-binding Zn-ribbon protein